MRIIEEFVMYLDIASVEQAEVLLEKACVFLIRSVASGIIL
jgi:hypothetical protein